MAAPRKYWLSSYPFSRRSLNNVPPQTDASPSASLGKAKILDDEENQVPKSLGVRPHSLYDRRPWQPPSSPTMSDIVSEDHFEDVVPLSHPHPTTQAPPIGVPLYFAIKDHPSLDLEDRVSSSPTTEDEISLSPTPSLVPTVLNSRSSSPMPHSCVAAAEALGIKVRDFAYEEHGVPLAAPVSEVEILKARYELYRDADLTPPFDVVKGLRDYDEDWLMEKKQFFDEKQRANNSSPSDASKPWRRAKGKVWSGAIPVDRSTDDSCTFEDSISDASLAISGSRLVGDINP